MKFSPLVDEALCKSVLSDSRCPTCNIAWWLFPPSKIADSDCRCVECKEMFKASTVFGDQG